MDYNRIVSLVWQAKKFVNVSNLDVKEKNRYDFVTQADINISNFLKENLAKAYPNVGFVTEEEDVHTAPDERFILDPIDGTTNLIYNYHQSAISLAYVKKDAVQFGVVLNPFTNEMFFAIRGCGSYLYDTSKGIDPLLDIGVQNYKQNKLSVQERPLQRSIVEFGAGSSFKDQAKDNFARAERVFRDCLDIRRICCTALSICYLAAGRIDGYFEKVIKPWDFAAAILILEEAGGKSSTWDGEPLPLVGEPTIICATPAIYDWLLNEIKNVDKVKEKKIILEDSKKKTTNHSAKEFKKEGDWILATVLAFSKIISVLLFFIEKEIPVWLIEIINLVIDIAFVKLICVCVRKFNERKMLKSNPKLKIEGLWHHVHIPHLWDLDTIDYSHEYLSAGYTTIMRDYHDATLVGHNKRCFWHDKKQIVEEIGQNATEWSTRSMRWLSSTDGVDFIQVYGADTPGNPSKELNNCPYCSTKFRKSKQINEAKSHRYGVHTIKVLQNEYGSLYLEGTYADCWPSMKTGKVYFYRTVQERDEKIKQYFIEKERLAKSNAVNQPTDEKQA